MKQYLRLWEPLQTVQTGVSKGAYIAMVEDIRGAIEVVEALWG